jgi:hypothetical protein
MTAILEWEGIPEYVIGIARGISAVIGIAATVVYPMLQHHISGIRTGLWPIWSQVQIHKMNLNCISYILCKHYKKKGLQRQAS